MRIYLRNLRFAKLTDILKYVGATFFRPSVSTPDLNSPFYGFNTVAMNVSKYEEILKDRDLSFLLEVIRNYSLCMVFKRVGGLSNRRATNSPSM